MNAKPTRTMTNEIKVGDKVRVREDAPRIYTPDWTTAMFDLVLKVTAVEDDNAMVEFEKRTPYRTVLTTIPTKYLVKVDAEAKEANLKYKVGDRVKFKNIYELQKVKDKSFRWMLVMFASKEATITAVEDNGFYRVDIDPSIGGINDDMIECKVEPTGQTEAKKNDSDVPFSIFRDDLLSNPQIVNLHNGMHYWQFYEAELAKEIVLKVANKFNDPEQTAEYAVKVAKAVAEGLKKK